MKRTLLILGLACWAGATPAGDGKKHDDDKDHVIVRPDGVKWGAAPAALPKGAQLAVLAGDPGKPGAYTIRAKMPDGYRVPPHWHPEDENVTVLKGTLMVGRGEKFNADKAEALPAGSYMRMPKTMRHFAFA